MIYLLNHLLARSAKAHPDSVAVVDGGRSLTYRELDAWSDAVATLLQSKGVFKGDRVGIYHPKSLESVVAIFAILKTGAAYIPVDPTAPPKRLEDIGAQCHFRGVITASARLEKTMEGVAVLDAVEFVMVSGEFKSEATEGRVCAFPLRDATDEKPCDPGLVDDDLAYVLFTSGSTGAPKGVMLSHRNALTFVEWAAEEFGLGPADRVSSHAPFHFDLSIFDLYASVAGASAIVLVPEGLSTFPIRLSAWIEKQQITVWYSVPMILVMMLTHGKLQERNWQNLRVLLFAGEVFPIKHLRECRKLFPWARFANLYGPTETNVCTWHEVGEIPEDQAVPVPIGKPCPNTENILIDEEGGVVSQSDVPGLLYVRGGTVMKGYYGRPEESAAAFIRDPRSSGNPENLYCTGDWVVLDEQSRIHFIGRRDHMVKTRGYRVELGEIEAALYRHPSVKDAAVVAVPDELMGNRLIAFVVPSRDVDLPSPGDLKIYLGTCLPTYMVPETVVLRENLPRTSTDKIDRRSLQIEAVDTNILSS